MIFLRFVLTTSVLLFAVTAHAKSLKFDFNTPTSIPQKYLGSIECPKPIIQPPQDLLFNSVYRQDDPTRSIVDPIAKKKYRAKTLPLMRFENHVIQLANNYLKSGEKNPKHAQCALDWLYNWAQQRALLSEDNLAGEIARQWTLASLSSAYLQIRNEPTLDWKKQKRVQRWLKSLAAKVIKSYPFKTTQNIKKNNHLYWASWAVTATGIALNDRDLFNWGINRARFVIVQQIDSDGTLPLEIQRGSKALHYHQFAANPLVMLAEAGLQNDINLYAYKDGKLHFFIKRILVGFQNSTHFEKKTGIKQKGLKDLSAGNLAWLEVYNHRFPNPTAKQIIAEKGKMHSRRLGGDMTFLFGDQN